MKRNASIVLIILIGSLFITACATAPVLPPQPWTDIELASGIRIQVRPAVRGDLIARFGSPGARMNPLLDYPSAFSGQRIMVFEVRMDSPQYEVELVTRKTALLFDNAKSGLLSSADARALNAQELQEAWMPYVEGTSRVQELIRKARQALPGDLLAGPAGPASGYLVFLHKFPKYGASTLFLALRAANGDTGVIQVRIGTSGTAGTEQSSGIFVQP